MKYSDGLTFTEKCQFFSTGKAGVREGAAGPDLRFAPRYRPTIGGQGVAPRDMPEFGYETRGEALTAARKFKMSARDALADATKAA